MKSTVGLIGLLLCAMIVTVSCGDPKSEDPPARVAGVPQWFDDAKLGIFIHWGLYSVPAWAPIDDRFVEVVNRDGWYAALSSFDPAYAFAHNVYAEWYLNTLRCDDSATRRHHEETYGADFSYDDFVPIFNDAADAWDPDEWASLFADVGARYVVITTKHHDGFLLWHSETPCPTKEGYMARRDIVAELTDAVRARGMRMGLYYSGGLDWAWSDEVIDDFPKIFGTVIQEPEFVDYVDAHWRELIDRFRPAVLWNDIGYPQEADLDGLLAHYASVVPDGAVNDRFRMTGPDGERYSPHHDYVTPEYTSHTQTTEFKWETCRGIGYSFGYNVNDDERTYLSTEELIHLFVDIVSKNGNLLLNVGPMADGTIPAEQLERLEGLGSWLDTNGEAVFESRPWVRSEGTTGEGTPVRFTRRGDSLYAIVLGPISGGEIRIDDLVLAEGVVVDILGGDDDVTWRPSEGGVIIDTGSGLPEFPAGAIRLTPAHNVTVSG
jgi:alpha-L-fucosidase